MKTRKITARRRHRDDEFPRQHTADPIDARRWSVVRSADAEPVGIDCVAKQVGVHRKVVVRVDTMFAELIWTPDFRRAFERVIGGAA